MLGSGALLRDVNGRLRVSDAEADRALRAAVAATGLGRMALGANGVEHVLMTGPDGRYVAHVLPLLSTAAFGGGAAVALFVRKTALNRPAPPEVLAKAKADELACLVVDGTLIESDRVRGVTEAGNDLWYSGKHKDFGGNVQGLSGPDGQPLWVSDVEPGSVHDITAARAHVLGALYVAAGQGLSTLSDLGYQGAGIGILTPVKRLPGGNTLAVDNQAYNKLQRGLRAPGERMFAILKERYKVLRHVRISPNRIGDLVRAALVVNLEWQNG
jgi:hypothetical protein